MTFFMPRPLKTLSMYGRLHSSKVNRRLVTPGVSLAQAAAAIASPPHQRIVGRVLRRKSAKTSARVAPTSGGATF